MFSSFLFSPGDNADQRHGGFIQAGENIPQRFPLILHIG